MIHGIHHTAISTPDIDRALRFYRDLLGFEEVWSSSWDKGSEVVDRIVGLRDSSARVAMLKAGNACVELFQYTTPTPHPSSQDRPVCDHGITHLCVQVSDVDAEYARLSAAGMRFHCPPQAAGKGVRATYGRDPDGNVVELLEVTDSDSMPQIARR
jgi:catechol 2,3-dioxygenase-like lactoylglutathione lyase family enzyme